ncbi:unnamed protein product [Pieris brassicae]|uniref:Retropepsins domain-containing protein n=1 Tax=Pieris brassicae TaxID=7116 RepID=A0A9P0SR24_PIEBR|nr:unnamed protein product [Pieris brassicae]
MLGPPKVEETSPEKSDESTDPKVQPKSSRQPSPSFRSTRSKSKTTEMDINALLKFIKPYDGSRENLNAFIIKCTNAMDLASDIQKPMLFKYIVNSLEGKAATTCAIKEFSDWSQLKDFLKTQFSEHKHYTHLLTELQESKQGVNEPVSQFSLRVETSLFNLLTEISLGNYPQKEIPGRIASTEDLALHHFLMGLLPRLSNLVRARNPKNLNSAVNLAMSEEKIQNSQFTKRHTSQGQPNSNNKSQNTQSSSGGKPNYNSQNKPYPNYPSNSHSSKQPSLFCRYCKATGHEIKDCELRITNNTRRNQKPANTPSSRRSSNDPILGNQPQQSRRFNPQSSNDPILGNQPQQSRRFNPQCSNDPILGNQPQQSRRFNPQCSNDPILGNQPQQSRRFNPQCPNDPILGNQPQQSRRSNLSVRIPPIPNKEVYEINIDTTKRLLPHILIESQVSDNPLSLLVDSGSAICLLKESSIHVNRKLNKELIKIKGIDPGDEPTQTEGHFQLKLKTSKTKFIPFKFHVVKNINLPYDGIIGTDFLTEFGCKIDYTCDILKIDHKPLQWLFNCKDPGSRLIRWRLKLEEFEYDIKYKKGKINSNADALSRYPVNPVQPESDPGKGGEPVDRDLMDLLISPPSFHPEELLSPTSNPITLEGNDLLPLPEIEPNSTSSELSNQMTGSPAQIPEVTPQLSEEQPTAQNIYDDPMPSTSANPDLPVDDYPTFLKSMANKDKIFHSQPPQSFQSIVSQTHQHIKNFQEQLRDVEERHLVQEERYLSLVGLAGHVELWKNTTVPVLVTHARNDDHALVVAFIGAAQKLPYTILVYNLGLKPYSLNVISNYCNSSKCVVIDFDLTAFPAHVNDESITAFRPLVIQHALSRVGGVVYCSAASRWRGSAAELEATWRGAATSLGVVAWPRRAAVTSLTHPHMFTYFHADVDDFLFVQMLDTSRLVLAACDRLAPLMRPWVQCALTADCIMPVGAQSEGCRFDKKPQYRYSGCHGQDASALSIILGLRSGFEESGYTGAAGRWGRASAQRALSAQRPLSARRNGSTTPRPDERSDRTDRYDSR